MPSDYLTIKEAAERFGKAEITIRRLVREIVAHAEAKERSFIRPGPDETAKLKKQRKPFSYAVSESLLAKSFGAAVASAQKKIRAKKTETETEEAVTSVLKKSNAQLEDQLRVKDEQIRALSQALDGLTERQRETNILMKGLQERLLIEPPKKKHWWKFGAR